MQRRAFLKSGLCAAAYLGTQGLHASAAECCGGFKTKLQKALIAGKLDAALCDRLAAAGFPGIELSDKSVSLADAKKARALAESRGIKIHSFMGGWLDFNHKDPAKRAASIEDAKQRLRLAAAYGANAMLVVPGRLYGIPMPKPSQFDIAFHPGTLMMTRAVAGDNAPFAKYIQAQNDATRYAMEAVNQLIPVAKQEGVVIALENVWNHLWVKPAFASAFIRSFQNPFVQAYFDMGNHVRYAPVAEWFDALRGMIVKLHIKDFLINRAKPNEGDFVPIGKGSIDWVAVRKEIEKVGYSGWVSIESEGYTDAEHSKMMDRFFAGKPILG